MALSYWAYCSFWSFGPWLWVLEKATKLFPLQSDLYDAVQLQVSKNIVLENILLDHSFNWKKLPSGSASPILSVFILTTFFNVISIEKRFKLPIFIGGCGNVHIFFARFGFVNELMIVVQRHSSNIKTVFVWYEFSFAVETTIMRTLPAEIIATDASTRKVMTIHN